MVTRGESAKPGRAPLTILRVETVLSRFPMHTLSKTGSGTIHIRKPGLHGTRETRWEVSSNTRSGPPRLVAEGTPRCALGLAGRVAVDEALEARVGLPSFAVWRQTQEVC